MTSKLYVDKSVINNSEDTIEILIMTPYGRRSVRRTSYNDDGFNFSSLSDISTIQLRHLATQLRHTD